jgi:hypothetical protein
MESNVGGPTGGPAGSNPRDMVSTPAILLMVVGGITVALALVGIVQNLMGSNTAQMEQLLNNSQLPAGARSALMGMSKGGIFTSLLSLGLGGVVFFGAMKMKNLENYTLAMAASIISVIPCFGCCCIGIPVGIWSLVILNKPEVKAAFQPSQQG